ncbi:KpsF/GutQ family sugar-phosphate isomerase [Rhabdochromatium marinum]|uniref:KpsF/GutQ family sugar-phosphate isomerase n=1 Tax=Rhabdochromatium marinum TaxID=48729 RepID=UPI001903DA04|nr:KpsF/GutQ family sugar-phosphate isomerase [Rhabdochromatium marinum]MBK1647795.1 arabinose-5-phosphate isomerase [Rhabdochromatium marinum]
MSVRAINFCAASDLDFAAIAREVFRIESEAVAGLAEQINGDFSAAVTAILRSVGRTIVCGMGKSGIIGKKISATLASTGTPSFFMHPSEAYHGDLGMVDGNDIFIAISHSGETEELLRLLPFLRDNGNTTIALTGNTRSTLARQVEHHLWVPVAQEACPLQLAPTASTTATLAMGDALAVALMRARDFQAHHFARFHPGGSLGRRMLALVRDEMCSDNLPFIQPDALAAEVVATMSSGRLGMAIVSQDRAVVLGVITDGDLRRALESNQQRFFASCARDMMTPDPIVIGPDSRMSAAVELMAQHHITSLIVVDDTGIRGVVQK